MGNGQEPRDQLTIFSIVLVPVSAFVLLWTGAHSIADQPGAYRVCSDFRQNHSKVFGILTVKFRRRTEIPLQRRMGGQLSRARFASTDIADSRD